MARFSLPALESFVQQNPKSHYHRDNFGPIPVLK